MINLKEYENDTVYTITPEGLQKRYIIDTGKYGIKLEHTFAALHGDEAAYNRLAAGYYALCRTGNGELPILAVYQLGRFGKEPPQNGDVRQAYRRMLSGER